MTEKPRFLFKAWRGAYADNPRAVSEALGEFLPHARQCWASDGQSHIPEEFARRRFHSPGYFTELMRTDVLISNDLTVRFPPRRKPLLYLQTWHGTPLKRIGWDASAGPYALSDWYLRKQDADVARWDLLISPSSEVTAILRNAFRYSGRVIECGYPRNDVLAGDVVEPRRALVRRRLGLADDTRTILYAPTWRAHSRAGARPRVDHPFMDAAFLAALPDDVVVLARLHPLDVAAGEQFQENARLIDLGRYPDVQDLLAVADVLVTDYSSLVFDFAITGRPMVLYAYDLHRYQDQERGFYFDYEATAPGAVVGSRVELIDALLAALNGQHDDPDRVALFRQRFCANEDGRATTRLITAILEMVA